MLRIDLHTVLGRKYALDVDKSDTFAKIKNILVREFDLEPDRMEFISDLRVLDQRAPISELNIDHKPILIWYPHLMPTKPVDTSMIDFFYARSSNETKAVVKTKEDEIYPESNSSLLEDGVFIDNKKSNLRANVASKEFYDASKLNQFDLEEFGEFVHLLTDEQMSLLADVILQTSLSPSHVFEVFIACDFNADVTRSCLNA